MRTPRRFTNLLACSLIFIMCLASRAGAIEHATTPIDDETRDTLVAAGTLIRVAMVQTVSSAHCQKGQAFSFKVLDDVKAGSRVAIPAGTAGTGKVTECRPAHGGREDGMLHIEFDPIALPDTTQVTVGITHDSLVADANEKNGTGPALEDIANMMLPGFFIIDFLRKGDDVTLAAGSPFHIAVTEDAFLSQ